MLIADRTTGLAEESTSSLFELPEAGRDAQVTSTAIIEELPETTIGVGRADARIHFYTDPAFSPFDPTPQSLEDRRRAEWRSADIAAAPRILLTRSGSLRGRFDGLLDEANQPVMLTVPIEQTPPARGQRVVVEPGYGAGDWPSQLEVLHVATLDGPEPKTVILPGADWQPRFDEDESSIRFYQELDRVEGAKRVRAGHELTVTAPLALSAGERVRLVGRSSVETRFGTVDSAGASGPVVRGLSATPAVGTRIGKCIEVTGESSGALTLRLKSDGKGLNDGDLVLVEDKSGAKVRTCFAANADSTGMDVFVPDSLDAGDLGVTRLWRTVEPVSSVVGNKFAVVATIAAHGLAVVTRVHISELGSAPELTGDYFALPLADGANTQLALCQPVSSGTTSGTPVFVRPDGTEYEIDSVRGQAPLRIQFKAPDPLLKTGHHGKIRGIKEIAEDDVVFLEVVGDSGREFALYRAKEAPPQAPRQLFWDRVDRGPSRKITKVEGSAPTVVHSPLPVPKTGQLVRILAGSKHEGVFVARTRSANEWETWRPVDSLSAAFWSRLQGGDAERTDERQRPRLKISSPLRKTPAPIVMYDGKGNRVGKGKLLQRGPTELRSSCAILEELVNDQNSFAAAPAAWRSSQTIGVTVASDTLSLRFGPVPVEDVSGEPPGSTRRQSNPIERVAADQWSDHVVAVTVDGDDLMIWPVGTPGEVEPLASIDDIGTVSALATRNCGKRLSIATLVGKSIKVFQVWTSRNRLHAEEITAAAVDSGSTMLSDPPPQLVLTEDEQQLVVGLGGAENNADEEPQAVLKTWRLPISSAGPPLPNERPQRLWSTSTFPTAPVGFLAAGATAGSPHFLVEQGGTLRQWSPGRMIRIRSGHRNDLAPQASLPVDLGADVLPEHDIAARLTPARAVAVSLVDQHSRTARAHLRIVQGVTRCLTLSPTTADARRGRQGLVIWPSGDLADPRISTSLSDLSVRHSTANVTIHIGGENVTLNQFHEVRLAVISSTLARPTAARHESLTLAVEGEIENGKLTLLLEGTVEEELGSSNRKPFTGLLSLSDEENKLIRQAMIRCDVAPQADGSLVLRVRNDLFWRILAERPAVVSQKPDIVLPRAGVDASFAYSVAPIQLAEGIQFVELKLRRDSSGMHLETVPKDEADVPLIPDLEPSRLRSPDRIGEETTRLAHRRRGGLVLRPSIPEDKFRAFDQLDSPSRQRARDKEPENPGCLIGLFSWLFGRRAQNPEPAPAPTVPASTQALDPFDLLEPVVEHDGPLFRLRPEGCLVSFDFAAVMGERWMTDGLIVLSASGPQADQQGDLLPFVASLESRTLELDSAGRVERQRYRALIAESGAAGIAAHFRVPDAGAGEQLPADFAFVDSPFFDNPGIRQSGAAGSDDLLDANGEQLFEPLVAGLPAFDKSEALDPSKSAVAVDFRLLPPIAWESEVGFAVEHRYIVADLPFDPQADVCCLAHRHYRLLRHSSSLPASESFDGQETPVLHVSDVPAFRQPATLRFSSAGNWVRATTQNNGDSPPPSSVFFPRRLDWELAADKPGAMFQTLVQARTTTHSGVSRREPSIDFAYREPQFVRLGGCVTADVEWQEKGKDDKFTVVAEDARDRLDATLVWREIVGAVDIAPLAANGTTAWLSLAPEASGIALTEPPLQLIISFNSEVISVRQADAAVPAYRIQSQIDEQFGLAARNVVQPASTFLFTHLLFDKLTETRTLYDKRAPKASWPALRLISTVVGSESNLAALEGAADAALDGARVELTGFESTDFEQTDRRLIMLDDNPKRYLVGDEVVNLTPEKTDSADPYPIPGTELANINGSGDIYRITATRSNRPLHFQLELKVGSALPPSGTIVETQTTGTGTVSEFGNLRTGGNIPAGGKLILCQLAEGEYALFAPARFAGAEVDPTGAAHPLETRAQPYLEASPRVAEVQVRAERPPNAAMDSTWGAGLTIEDSTGFKPGEYIRLAESDHLEADGVFCLTQYKDVMGGDVSSRLALCRPSVSIGAGTATAGGEIARSKPSARTAALTNVEGKSPIRVTFVEGTESELANWDGASVIVRGVDGNRSAEGTWVLGNRSYDEDQQKVSFDLLEPAISPPLSELARPSTGPALTFVAVGSRVVELEEAFRPTGSRGLATLDANAIPQWEPTDRPLLQIYWAGAADHLAAGEFAFKTRRGGDMTQLYEQAKQIKFLANSQLSPKLIFVVNVLAEGETEDDQKPVFHRTMLFGDSAPVFDAQPTLEPANGTVEQFVLQIPDNEEQLSVQLPRNVPSTGAATLYVVKSLPSGVAVFNTIDVAWPRPTP
ncbi:MAG: hypothetical protein MPJ50_05955 [Pirellulales bacterium]|nr:hypothetical protein [Pirellulales bacterium]